MTRVYLGLGSNQGDRQAALQAGLQALPAVGLLTSCSSVYETAPWGEREQPDFLNLCCGLDTVLAPRELLAQTQAIEQRVGRRPTYRWGPRVLDIDILTYDQLTLEEPGLVLPHPRLAQRAFVLAPLAEIAPHLVIACGGNAAPQTAAGLLVRLGDVSGEVRWAGPPPSPPPTATPTPSR